jgi:hypothetical protein
LIRAAKVSAQPVLIASGTTAAQVWAQVWQHQLISVGWVSKPSLISGYIGDMHFAEREVMPIRRELTSAKAKLG